MSEGYELKPTGTCERLDRPEIISIDPVWLGGFIDRHLESRFEKANLQYLREYADTFASLQTQIDTLNSRLTKEVCRQDNDHNSLWVRQSEIEKSVQSSIEKNDEEEDVLRKALHQRYEDSEDNLSKLAIELATIEKMVYRHEDALDLGNSLSHRNLATRFDDMLNHHADLEIALYQLKQKFENNLSDVNTSFNLVSQEQDGICKKINIIMEETKFLDQWCDKNSIRLDAIEKKENDIQQIVDAIKSLSAPSEYIVNHTEFTTQELDHIKNCVLHCIQYKKIFEDRQIDDISFEELNNILKKISEIQPC